MQIREPMLMPLVQTINNETVINFVNSDTYSLNHGDLYLNEGIDDDMSKTFLQQILYLNTTSSKFINVWIDSPGGYCKSCFTMLNAIEMSKVPIRTIVTGIAASSASLILAHGTPGHRYAFPDAMIMIHNLTAGSYGNEDDLKQSYESAVETNNRLQTRLSKTTGKPVEYLKKLMEKDTYFNAVQAKRFGLIDKICTKNFLNNL